MYGSPKKFAKSNIKVSEDSRSLRQKIRQDVHDKFNPILTSAVSKIDLTTNFTASSVLNKDLASRVDSFAELRLHNESPSKSTLKDIQTSDKSFLNSIRTRNNQSLGPSNRNSSKHLP